MTDQQVKSDQGNTDDLRALARGYRALYEDAVAGLLRIVDETTSRDEAVDAAREALREVGVLGADE